MIHLSRFLIGIRHSRAFRMQNHSGQIIDEFVKLYPKDFTRVEQASLNNEITLSDSDNLVKARVTIDDVIMDAKKIFDWEKKSYVEINRLKIINMTKSCLPIITKRLDLDRDYSRIGIIYEFRIPEFKGIVSGNFGKFIYDNFISFHKEGESSEASLRFVYKLAMSGGMVIKDLKDYRNVIIMLKQSKGIDEDGTERNCLFVSIDMQRIFDPSQRNVDVDEHYKFVDEHLRKVILPELKTKGVTINL